MSIRARLLRWALKTIASRPFDFAVGPRDSKTMFRWFILPRNRWFNIYLHQFAADDYDRALHDHMYISCSILLREGYWETLDLQGRKVWRPQGSIIFRWPSTPHRVVLDPGRKLAPISLFITGPRWRVWGFHCPNGWVPFQVMQADPNDHGVNKSCEDVQFSP